MVMAFVSEAQIWAMCLIVFGLNLLCTVFMGSEISKHMATTTRRICMDITYVTQNNSKVFELTKIQTSRLQTELAVMKKGRIQHQKDHEKELAEIGCQSTILAETLLFVASKTDMIKELFDKTSSMYQHMLQIRNNTIASKHSINNIAMKVCQAKDIMESLAHGAQDVKNLTAELEEVLVSTRLEKTQKKQLTDEASQTHKETVAENGIGDTAMGKIVYESKGWGVTVSDQVIV